jgi:hypothetical protein
LGGAAGSESLRVLTPGLAGNYAQINTNSFGEVIYGNAGSGTNIPNFFLTKGTGVHRFATNTSISNEQFRVSHTASAVNYVQVTGAATGARPTISGQGSDANVGLDLASKNTAAVGMITNSAKQFDVFGLAGSVNFIRASGNTAGNAPQFASLGTDTNIDLTLVPKGTGAVRNVTGGGEQLRVSNTASAVNFVQVTGAATGNSPIISAQGSDANTGLWYYSKGFGGHRFYGYNGSSIFGQFYAAQANPVNYLQIGASSSGNALPIQAVGSDTNISQVFQSKGTGAINLAPGSSGVNISNGGTVTAITRTAAGGGYTSVPSVAISAPTTAGGVQATATATAVINGITSIQSGGTGYTVNDVLTVVGGTATTQTTQLTVSTVSAGVITGVTISRFGTYSTTPTNPADVTGGTGTGATFNLNYAVQTSFTITNAGSGYVEQPTVTFSGGGGSGAAAYAVVGSSTTVKTIGANLSFNTPGSGEVFRVSDTSSTGAYFNVFNSGGSSIARFVSNISGAIQTNSAVPIQFQTNASTTPVEQLRVAHTASAVNFVQVTGAATAGNPTISAQGSDANVRLLFVSKGSLGLVFQTRGGGTPRTALQLTDGGAASVNAMQIQSALAGSAPILSSFGTDTDIDLALTPKGTGNVRFGTFTADMTLIVQGYVEIKTADGVVRKLAVIA